MPQSIEELQRAIDGATAAGDQQAVDLLTTRQGEVKAQMDDTARGEILSGQTGALNVPIESEGAALEKPATNEQIDTQLEGALKPTVEDRKQRIAQYQFEADQALMDSEAGKPTDDQISEFMKSNTDWQFGVGPVDSMSRQVVIDQATGKPRWSALSPDQLVMAERRNKKRGSTRKAVVGALGYGSTRFAGALSASAEAKIEANNNFQEFLLTGDESLPKAEQERIMTLAREKYGADSEEVKNPGTIPAHQVKQWIDMNEENNLAFRNIAGDEWWEERKEFMARGLSKLSSLRSGKPLFGFGADTPTGDLTGPGSYEGIDYTGKRAPSYPGASEQLRNWEADAGSSQEGIYEGLILPITQGLTGKTPAQHITEYSDSFIDDSYDEEQLAERAMPIFSADIEINNIADLWESVTSGDPNTKLMNPESLFLMFMENAVELGISFAVTRGAGSMAARSSARNAYGQTVERMNKARETAAGRAGMLAGGGTEGILVQGHVEQETRSILEQIPLEVWEKNPLYAEMVEAGISPEGAKQILSQEKASQAGTTAAVVTMLSGAPMNRLMGQSAAGRLVQSNVAARRTAGALGEPLVEGAQEVMEMLQTEAVVGSIDPDNPIFADPNRYVEAFSAGALISLPFGASAALEPSQPVGLDKADVAAARATAKYMTATNERFKFETSISSPKHIENTTPIQRLKELDKLEKMQVKESQSILDAEPLMRTFLEKQGTQTAKTELKMLNRLVMRANAMKNDIAVAHSKRTTAAELQEIERQVMGDRAELQQKVNEQIIKLEDIQTLSTSIEAVQNLEAVSPEQETNLIKEGYARLTKDGRLIVLPKGKRATKELNRQGRALQSKLDKGYTGKERRQPENLIKRDLVESSGPVEKEQMLFQDYLTGVQNRRAFNERQENIDVREGQEKTPIEGAAPATAAVDVDSLAWVNDNMSHSAGDRLLLAVSDALGKQKGVEVFRLGGDEFVVTGASQEALETAMQAAATELSETEIISGEDVVTPQITWGKGENYEEADAESLTMKEDRQSRNIIAKRKKKAATYKHRAQKGLFQRDSGEPFPRYWHQVRDIVERGDSVEVLTPNGAMWGVVTNVTNKRGRPRLTVNIQGRKFLFNPSSNHLIVARSNPADLAWISGDADYAVPGRETFPQTLSDVNIGELASDGNVYADLADDFEDVDYQAPLPWWMTSYPEFDWHKTIPYMPVEKKATDEQIEAAVRIATELTAGMSNLPKINIVRNLEALRQQNPDVVQQIKDELVAMGGSGSFNGVRGYMDHVNPQNGIYIFPAHISSSVGSTFFEQGVVETVWHELIGHYGVRGMFGNEADLREKMHELVDAFPRLADFYSGTLGLNKTNLSEKQLLGEEMVAYIAGKVKSGEMKFNQKQKSLWAKFVAWIKSIMAKRHMDRFSPIKKFVSIHETREVFWNDSRVQDLLSRSRDFVRHGNGFQWTPLEDTTKTFMRDRDVFQAGFVTAMTTATYKPSNREKKELAKRYGGKENVPDEIALFPDDATPNGWKQLLIKAGQGEKKLNLFTDREMELSGLSEKSDFYLFRDASYETLRTYLQSMNGGNNLPSRWYQDVLPANVAAELDDINVAMDKNYLAGPLRSTGTDGGFDGDPLVYHYEERPVLNKFSADMMRERIAEIMTQKLDPKKTRLTKEIMLAHMLSDNVFRIFVERQGGAPRINLEEAQTKLFGELNDEEVDALTDEQMEMIKTEQKLTRTRGYNIGYDKDRQRWFDYARHTNDYSEWSPQGSRYNSDYRVMLIKSEGRQGEMGYSGHYDRNVMHIRTGMAKLLDWDGMPELEFPDPDMQGQMLSLIELQSDWLQKLRKGFSSQEEKEEGRNKLDEKRTLLNMVGNQFGRGVSQDIWQALNEMLKPVLNLPDGSSDMEVSGTLFRALRERALRDTGDVYEDLTSDQKRETWKAHAVEELDKVTTVLIDSRAWIEEELIRVRDLKLPGSMDARGFEVLDNLAMRHVLLVIKAELNVAVSGIQDTLRYSVGQTEMVNSANMLKRQIGRKLDKVASSSVDGEGMRLPMLEYQLKPMLEIFYSRLGADKTHIAELMSGLKVREMATVRIPIQALKDANTAMTTGFDPKALMNDILAPSRISEHSDIAPGSMSFTATTAGDDFIDIKVVGSKEDINKTTELVPKLISTWLDDNAQAQLNLAKAQRENPSSGEAEGELSFNELVEAYGLEEEDVDGEGTTMMSDHNVTSYYQFEEQEEGDLQMEAINEAFNNMTEDEWNELDGDHEGVGREGTTYRDNISVDAEGDVDNEHAESELNDARESYRSEEMYEDDTIRETVYEQLRELWDGRGPPALIHGSLPISWNADNEPVNYVTIMIKAEDAGDAYDILIDDEEVDYEGDLDNAKDGLSKQIQEYYNDNQIIPPAGVPFGPTRAPVSPDQVDAFEEKGPNWDIVKGNIVENMAMMSDAAQKMDKVFEDMVTLAKKVNYGQVHMESPVGRDEQWRPLALKYLISDAVRRGLGGVMWNNGLSSSTRGGMGQAGVTTTSSMTWSKETVGIRGEQQDVYVIRYPESDQPLVLSRTTMIPALGSDIARMIYMQENGKLESPDIPDSTEPKEGEGPSRDDYIIATTEGGESGETMVVYRRSNNMFLGFADNDETVDTLIQQDIEAQGARRIRRRFPADGIKTPPTGDALGEVIAQGYIDKNMAGGPINIIVGDGTESYVETYGRPRLAGARQSYEDITVRQWNKELKKYGVHISDTYVKANDMAKATEEEGQPTLKSPSRELKIKEEHGKLFITETIGEMHNWIVMSEKKGPLLSEVFSDRARAESRLNDFITNNYGTDREGVKVMYFPINEKMREEFSGPVAPFHYDPKQDPQLKSAAKKFGYTPKPLRERISNWKKGMASEMKQGMVDQFFGLKKALNEAGVSDNSYISARMTTSLDSIMKGVLNYGHPVWKDGIVQSEGRGLLDIFQPILTDPDLWGLYMAGKRGKKLMLEGYNNLEPKHKAEIDAAIATKYFTDKNLSKEEALFEFLILAEKETPAIAVEVKATDLTKEERAAMSKAEVAMWEHFLPHMKREHTGSGGREAKARYKAAGGPTGRWYIFDWRNETKRNTKENIHHKGQLAANWLIKEKLATNVDEALKVLDTITEIGLKKQAEESAERVTRREGSSATWAFKEKGREHLFSPSELKSMVALGDKMPHFERVAKDYAAFNKKMLDFGEASGIIDGETRPLWESADYVPFYRVDDNRLVGSGMSPTAGIANQRAPIRRLRGGKQNVSDIMGNIMMNVTKLMDASVKNSAALESVDALRGTGIISKKPMDWSPEIIPLAQMKKVLMDKGVIVPEDQVGIHLSDIPQDALTGMQKMFALKAPQGDGIISVMRKGKREYYYTDDMLLFRSLSSINKKHFGEWINIFRAPKRLLTSLITIDPAFMLSNFIRDTGSAFVIGRDKGNLPVLSAIKGFGQALMEDKTMRTLVSAGAAFENGFVTGGDPRQTKRMLKRAMKKKSFANTVLDSPFKLFRAWQHLGSSIENSNRIAVYNAAIEGGKSKKRAAYEAKDLMDFSMGGDWPVTQFLIQTVPFMNARAQGIYRLGRGAVENPISFTIKGLLVSMAGLSLYAAFKDDDRYKELPTWDRHAYFHWWVGDAHYRLPKPFEVGAIFNTIPEMMFNYAYDKENDAGKTLLKEFAHMMAETFNMNPTPQLLQPLIEAGANYNFFTGRPIVSYYESKRLPVDQYRYRTSPLMIELARRLPAGLDTLTMGRARSPLHLQNMYMGFTGTIGRYILQGADMVVERMLDYPLPPAAEIQDYAVLGRFVRGENPPRRTKYETEVYRMLDKITAIQGSLNFHEKQGNLERYLETHTEHEPYIRVARDMEGIREGIQDINRAIMAIHLDRDMDREMKQKEIDVLEEIRNTVFKEGWKLRPGGEYNPEDESIETSQVIDLIDNWGEDNSTAFMRRIQEDAPDTYELLGMISKDLNLPQLASLAKLGADND